MELRREREQLERDWIARRAFELFCERRRQHGHDLDDWLQQSGNFGAVVSRRVDAYVRAAEFPRLLTMLWIGIGAGVLASMVLVIVGTLVKPHADDLGSVSTEWLSHHQAER